jgi:hypothetical protein
MSSFIVETRQHHGKWDTLCATTTETKAKAIVNMVIGTAQAPYARWGKIEIVYLGNERAEDRK